MQKIVTIREKLDTEILADVSPVNFHPPPSRLFNFTPIDESAVSEMISSSSNASCTLDPLPTKLLKSSCLEMLLPYITLLINLSLSTSEFPASFKTAIFSPLIKKANLDLNTLKNYRPVSNLSFISKLIEEAVSIQLRTISPLMDTLNNFSLHIEQDTLQKQLYSR